MPLTIFYHNSTPTSNKWKLIASDNSKYSKYLENMSSKTHALLIFRIVALTILTFGGYYIALNCMKNGRLDLANLRQKRIVHYVLNKQLSSTPVKVDKLKTKTGSGPAKGDSVKVSNSVKTAKPSSNLSKDLQKTDSSAPSEQQTVANSSAPTEPPNAPPSKEEIAQALKSSIKEVNEYRTIEKDILEIMKTKESFFLQTLSKKHKDLACAIEHFAHSVSKEPQSLLIFAYIRPFLKEKGIAAIITNALNEAKKKENPPKTPEAVAFEAFQKKFNELSEKTDWLISLKDKPFFAFACHIAADPDTLTEFLKHYDPALYSECINSMQPPFTVDANFKKELSACFKECKDFFNKIRENLYQQIDKSYAETSHSSLYSALWDKRYALEQFDKAVSPNSITADFIRLYQSGEIQLNHAELKKAAVELEPSLINKCMNQLAYEKTVKERLQSRETLEAFQKIKDLSSQYRDLISILEEALDLLEFKLPEYFNWDFRIFIRDITKERQVVNDSKPTEEFQKKFAYFFRYLEQFDEKLSELSTLQTE